MNQLTSLYGELLGSSVYQKSEENIDSVQYSRVFNAFKNLRSFWSKALFIVYLKDYSSESMRAIGDKLVRDMHHADMNTYIKRVQPHITEINRTTFRDQKELLPTMVDKLTEFGEKEYVAISRMIYHNATDNDWVIDNKYVVLTQKAKDEILIPY